MGQALSTEEQERLTAGLRPPVEGGQGEWRMAFAHLAATKPGAA